METVSVQIPGALYAAIYVRYEEETAEAISGCLNRLLVSAESEPPPPRGNRPQYPRPGKGTITREVWEIADQLEKTGAVDRECVVKACVVRGIKFNTANTQYSYWKKSAR